VAGAGAGRLVAHPSTIEGETSAGARRMGLGDGGSAQQGPGAEFRRGFR
jgi:hypothetical protein